MAGMQSTGAPHPNVLAGANAGNRRVLYEEVEQVTALRITLDAQYHGARLPDLPDLFTRAFASRGASTLELPTPPLPASFPRHPEPRQIQLGLKALLERHASETGGTGVTRPNQSRNSDDEDSNTVRLFTLLDRVSRNYEDLQSRIALAGRS